MSWRRKRTTPTVTELARVQLVLERDPALSRFLRTKSVAIRKRGGEPVQFAAFTVAVAQEMMAMRLNPERAHVRKVLRVAADLAFMPPGRVDE